MFIICKTFLHCNTGVWMSLHLQLTKSVLYEIQTKYWADYKMPLFQYHQQLNLHFTMYNRSTNLLRCGELIVLNGCLCDMKESWLWGWEMQHLRVIAVKRLKIGVLPKVEVSVLFLCGSRELPWILHYLISPCKRTVVKHVQASIF